MSSIHHNNTIKENKISENGKSLILPTNTNDIKNVNKILYESKKDQKPKENSNNEIEKSKENSQAKENSISKEKTNDQNNKSLNKIILKDIDPNNNKKEDNNNNTNSNNNKNQNIDNNPQEKISNTPNLIIENNQLNTPQPSNNQNNKISQEVNSNSSHSSNDQAASSATTETESNSIYKTYLPVSLFIINNNQKSNELKLATCIFCKGIAHDALLEEGNCSTVCCKQCYDIYCKLPSTSKKKVYNKNSNNILNRLILNYKIHCKNNSCKWEGLLKDLDSHLNTDCSKQVINCTNEGCNEQFLRENLESHLKICNYVLVECIHCHKKFPKIGLNAHFDICEEKLIECPLKCGEKIQRKKIEEHEKIECKKLIINCIYKDYGCDFQIERDKMNLHYKEKDHVIFVANVFNEKFKKVDKKLSEIKKCIELQESEEDININENYNKDKNKKDNTNNNENNNGNNNNSNNNNNNNNNINNNSNNINNNEKITRKKRHREGNLN